MPTETPRYTIGERRICWPNPDATCLHGGCSYCNYSPFKTLAQIERYAHKAGVLPHRGKGYEDAKKALQYGLTHEFFNVETRAARDDLMAYAETVGVLALKAMAEGMPGSTHGRKREDVLAWLVRNRRAVLDESFRKTSQGRQS